LSPGKTHLVVQLKNRHTIGDPFWPTLCDLTKLPAKFPVTCRDAVIVDRRGNTIIIYKMLENTQVFEENRHRLLR